MVTYERTARCNHASWDCCFHCAVTRRPEVRRGPRPLSEVRLNPNTEAGRLWNQLLDRKKGR